MLHPHSCHPSGCCVACTAFARLPPPGPASRLASGRGSDGRGPTSSSRYSLASQLTCPHAPPPPPMQTAPSPPTLPSEPPSQPSASPSSTPLSVLGSPSCYPARLAFSLLQVFAPSVSPAWLTLPWLLHPALKCRRGECPFFPGLREEVPPPPPGFPLS